MATNLHPPWEQLRGESPQAYAAFEVYLALGKGRTVVAAYRQSQRKPDAKQADGTWNKWAKEHRWAERARAYDNRELVAFERGLERGLEKVGEQAGRTYATLRDRLLREGIERWEKRLKQSDLIAAMPLSTQTLHRDGKTIVIQPVDVLDHYRATMIASRSQQRLVELLDRGLDLERDDAAKLASEAIPVPAPATTPLDLAPGVPNRLDAWRAYQRTQVIRIRRTDPREDDNVPGASSDSEPANGVTPP